MKKYLALLIYTLGLTGLANAAPLSEKQFTQVFAKALTSSDPLVAIEIKSDLHLTIKGANGEESTAFLDNAYTQYLQNPGEINEVLNVYVKSFLEIKTKPDAIDPTRIVPIIKDRAWLGEIRDAVKQRNGEKLFEYVFVDYNQDLLIFYAEDTVSNINYFSSEALAKLGIRKDQLRDLAVENLKRLIPKPQIQFGPIYSRQAETMRRACFCSTTFGRACLRWMAILSWQFQHETFYCLLVPAINKA